MNRKHEQAIREFLKYFHTKSLDIESIRAALAPNACYQPIVPMAPARLGADAICRELERQYRIYDQCDCEIIAIASSDHQVFVERVDTVKMFDGHEPRVQVVGVFELDENSRIVSWRDYHDLLDVAEQLEMTPEQMKERVRTAALEPAV